MPITSIPGAAEGVSKITTSILQAVRRFASRCDAAVVAFRRNPNAQQLALTGLEEEIFETHYRAQTAYDVLQHLIGKSDESGAVLLGGGDVEDLVAITKRVRRATCHLVNRCGSMTELRS